MQQDRTPSNLFLLRPVATISEHLNGVLTNTIQGSQGPTIVFLHWLGGSAKSWTAITEKMATWNARSVAIDLPGFGNAAHLSPTDTLSMALMVEATLISVLKPSENYVLVGHSMGGKVASVLARRAEAGDGWGRRPLALVLISPSPPAPEPMQESKRQEVTRELGDRNRDRASREAYSQKFVRDNVGTLKPEQPVIDAEAERTVTSSPDAFRLWLQHSSKEDYSDFVGTVQIPTVIFAGSEDSALGLDAQQELTLPHFANGRLQILHGAGHLAPLERPAELVIRIVEFLRSCGIALERKSQLSDDFVDLLRSDQTSPHTRRVLEARLQTAKSNDLFGTELSVTLRALVDCVLPSANSDLMDRLEETLGADIGDGWRFDALPNDVDAWRRGLQSLDHAAVRTHGVNFVALPGDLQYELLRKAQTGNLGKSLLGTLHLGNEATDFDGDEMKYWFEDVCGELAKLYASDPRIMDQIGFAGFADDKGFAIVEIEPTERKG